MWLMSLFVVASAASPCDPRAVPDLEVVGPGSRISGADELVVIDGIWRLTCTEGAGYFPAARRRTFGSAFEGSVLTPQDPAVLACYQTACALPEGLCIVTDDLGPRAVVCGHTAPATNTQWTARRLLDAGAREAARASWMDAIAAAEPTSAATPAPVSAPAAPPPRPAPAPTRAETTFASVAAPSAPTILPAAPASSSSPWTSLPATAPAQAPLVAPTAVAAAQLTPAPSKRVDVRAAVGAFTLPDAPPDPCPPASSRRDAGAAQVDLGDEQRVAGDLDAALGHYRAALAVDTCNGHAWGAIGSLLMEGGRTEDAERALAYGARLVPQNVRAWTELGRARETLGRVEGAIAAYHEALSRQDDYAPAAAGLRRVTHGP